jgi:hypothetical protein
MRTVVTLSGNFGATCETLPGQFHLVKVDQGQFLDPTAPQRGTARILLIPTWTSTR